MQTELRGVDRAYLPVSWGAPARRPLRLWATMLMNVASGLTGMAALLVLSTATSGPATLTLDAFTTLPAALCSAALIVVSLLALTGKPVWRRRTLVAATVFYGSILVQNLYLLALGWDAAPAQAPLVNALRCVLELGINFWVLRSACVLTYFAGRPPKLPA